MSPRLVLIVDDLHEHIEVLARHLADTYLVQYALSGPEALALVAEHPPDLILLDAVMPDMDGYAVCERLKQAPGTREIPVILVTARSDADSESRALAVGAVDFISKPVNRDVLRARVDLHLKLKARERELQRLNMDLERWAEEALRHGEQRFAGIVNSAMDAIISVDEEQRIVLFNPAAEQMFRLGEAEALGHPLARLIPERFRSAHAGYLRAYPETGATALRGGKPGLVAGLRADGEEFPAEASIFMSSLANGKLYTVILRDITERRQAEQARISYERQRLTIEAACRRHIAAQTAAAIAHELNQPLTAIGALVEICLRLLDMGNPDPHELRDDLEKCRQLLRQAGQALHEMLNLLYGEETPTEEVDLGTALKDVLAILKVECEPTGFRIVRIIDPALPKVRANCFAHVGK